MSSKESAIPGHLSKATLNWEWGRGERVTLLKAVGLEIILLRKVTHINEKTVSSSSVRDCRGELITARLFCLWVDVVLWAYNWGD